MCWPNMIQHDQHCICLSEEELQALWSPSEDCELIKYHLRIQLYISFPHYHPQRQSAQPIDSSVFVCQSHTWSLTIIVKKTEMLKHTPTRCHKPSLKRTLRINPSSTVKLQIVISKLTTFAILPNPGQSTPAGFLSCFSLARLDTIL